MRQFDIVIEETKKSTYTIQADTLNEAKLKAYLLKYERESDPDEFILTTSVYCKHFGVSVDK